MNVLDYGLPTSESWVTNPVKRIAIAEKITR
jgi:hypothetical protein